jgi:hypothetical protein
MKYVLSILSVIVFTLSLNAQVIEKVIVETYYITDANDATDTTGGHLSVGDTTYRVFIDLAKGYKLTKIYGDKKHVLRFASDSVFFNNLDSNDNGGVTFAKDLNIRRLKQNTIALDSWLTLGQIGKIGTKTYFGVPKVSDKNGAGMLLPNDGGSDEIATGLLANKVTAIGIPLTTSDGIEDMTSIPKNWNSYGFINFDTKIDSTIFGSLIPGKLFESHDCFLSNTGVMGVDPDSNQVLIAQLTTRGGLSFELNVEIIDSLGKPMDYVAFDNGHLSDSEQLSPFLVYPLVGGCLDPNYLEYNKKYGKNDQSQCKTPIIFGCLDQQACNYDSKANVNIASMCCYPGYCNDRDLSIVCPELEDQPQIFIYPNPSSNSVTLKFDAVKNNSVSYSITNESGTVVLTKDLGTIAQSFYETISISNFQNGLYHCTVIIGTMKETRTFIKQ